MRLGIARKCLRDAALPTVVCALGLCAFEIVLARVMNAMDSQFTEQVMRLGFVRVILQTLLGSELAEMAEMGPQVIRALVWVHPVILSLVWAHALTLCSRFPAGEIDQGTADVLLTFPVSRTALFAIETVVWLSSLAVVLGFGLVGHVVGFRLLPEPLGIEPGPTLRILVNFFLLAAAVGALTCCLSAGSSRRARVLGISIAIVLVSFFWNFVTQFWPAAKPFAFLSVLDYYQPMNILIRDAWPWADLRILGAATLLLWTAALWIFLRRDVATS